MYIAMTPLSLFVCLSVCVCLSLSHFPSLFNCYQAANLSVLPASFVCLPSPIVPYVCVCLSVCTYMVISRSFKLTTAVLCVRTSQAASHYYYIIIVVSQCNVSHVTSNQAHLPSLPFLEKFERESERCRWMYVCVWGGGG